MGCNNTVTVILQMPGALGEFRSVVEWTRGGAWCQDHTEAGHRSHQVRGWGSGTWGPGRGGGGTHSLGIGTNCETTPPPHSLAEGSSWISYVQIYSPLFSGQLLQITDPSNHQLSIFLFCFIRSHTTKVYF